MWGELEVKWGQFFTSPDLKPCLCNCLLKKTKPSTSSRVQHTYHQTTLPWIGFNITALELHCDVVSIDEEEVVLRKLKKSAKQTNNVASKEVQQVKERYLSSFSFIIFDISVPNHGVHFEHNILLWRIIWLLKLSR